MHLIIFYISTLLPTMIVLAFFGIRKTRREAAYRNQPHPPVRTASLDTTADNGRSWWLGLLPPLLLLGGTAFLLVVRLQTIPARFPIHWGIDGQPNGWANRSFGSVFGLPILAAALVAVFSLLGELIAHSSPGHEGRSAMIRTTRTILIACSWFVTILLCSISLLPLTHDSTNLVPFIMMLGLVFSLGIIGYVAYRATRMTGTIVAGQNSTDSRFWKAGIFYYNPGDNALMVPKRMGFGYTLNFGRPVSWLIFAVILLIPLLLPLLLRLGSR